MTVSRQGRFRRCMESHIQRFQQGQLGEQFSGYGRQPVTLEIPDGQTNAPLVIG